MNNSVFIRAALLPAIVVLPAASASAWDHRGQLAAHSEATIGIRVSVAPRFIVAPEGQRTTANPLIASNAPKLRFRIVQEPNRDSGSVHPLYLIVPD